jgi:hypothetical protein
MMLAMGTIAMAAGMRDEDLFFAAVALRQHNWALRGAALFQGGQRFALARQKRTLIIRQKFGFKGLDDRREPAIQSVTVLFINQLLNAH